MDMDAADQRKISEETDAQMDVPVINTTTSTVQTIESDPQAINLTASQPANVRKMK